MITNQQAWTIYARYLEGWRATEAAEREAIISEVIAPDVHYSTRNHASADRTAVIADAATFQAKFPGGHFEIGDVSTHHAVGLLTWVLIHDGKEVARGHDQLHVNAAGKVVELITFPPSQPAP